jgi:cob(I)alamin adenosyltransferase
MNLEQRINITFCVKIGKSASETLAILTVAYGEYAMKKSSVFEWRRQFKEGLEDVQDDPKSGQPKTQRTDANVDRARTLVRSDRRVGVRITAEEMNMNTEIVRQIVHICERLFGLSRSATQGFVTLVVMTKDLPPLMRRRGVA